MTSAVGAATDTYTYPPASNRLSGITLAAGGTRAYTYDSGGNLLTDSRGAGYAYTYDAAGRMASMSINGVLQGTYKYHFAGRQAIRTTTSPAITIHSVFDSQGRRIAEYNEATGALIREYVWLGWEPVAVVEDGIISYVRTDHIGRPIFGTNSVGTKIWTASYTPFGGVRTTTGTPVNARFPGQWFQSESGLHQNWMRDYDPTTGRYLQADPLGIVDGASVYGYAGQSPMMNVDPRGEEKQPYVLPLDPSGLGPSWVPVPHARAGNLYRCSCSDETLRFDPWNAGGNPSPHWHYYPDGSNLGKYGQYMTPETGPHLPPRTIIMIENCDSGGGGVPVPVPTEQTTRFMQFLFILGIIGGTIVFG